MANSRSARKRIQVAERNRLRNKSYKSAVKTLMKNYFAAVDEYIANPSPEAQQKANELQSLAASKIDKSVKRGVLHANNGARKKSRLSRYWTRNTAPATPSDSPALA